MRLFVLSILLISAVYATSSNSSEPIKCYKYKYKWQDNISSSKSGGTEDCPGACTMSVSYRKDTERKEFILDCQKHRPEEEEPCKTYLSGELITCTCQTNLCFKPMMQETALGEFIQTGNITMDSLNSATTRALPPAKPDFFDRPSNEDKPVAQENSGGGDKPSNAPSNGVISKGSALFAAGIISFFTIRF